MDHHGQDPYFLIQEEYLARDTAHQVMISSEVIGGMVRDHAFRLNRVSIKLSKLISVTEIFLCYNERESHPISGFPRNISHDGVRSPVGRKSLNANSVRWAGGSPSQRLRRHKWTKPNNVDLKRLGTVSRYSSTNLLRDLGKLEDLTTTRDRTSARPQASATSSFETENSSRFELPADEAPRFELDSTEIQRPVMEMATSYQHMTYTEMQKQTEGPKLTIPRGRGALGEESVSPILEDGEAGRAPWDDRPKAQQEHDSYADLARQLGL